MLAELRDDVFGWLEGTTDSEACFALVLNFLEVRERSARAAPSSKRSVSDARSASPLPLEPELLSADQGAARVPACAMRAAMLGAIALLRKFLAEEQARADAPTSSRLSRDEAQAPTALALRSAGDRRLLEHELRADQRPHGRRHALLRPGEHGAVTSSLSVEKI